MSIYYSILYFFVYGFLGWCTEVIFAAFKQHRFVNRGFLNGPARSTGLALHWSSHAWKLSSPTCYFCTFLLSYW